MAKKNRKEDFLTEIVIDDSEFEKFRERHDKAMDRLFKKRKAYDPDK